MAQLIKEAKRFQKLAGLITESQLNEEVINFKDKDEYSEFLMNGTKKLEGSKVKLKIYDTFANQDPEEQKYTGDISVNLEKRTGGTGNLKYDATLVDAGGYKYLSSAKGKKISLTIPSTTGGQGGFECEDPKIKGLFKVETLEILGTQTESQLDELMQMLDDEGNPLPDEEGNPVVPSTEMTPLRRWSFKADMSANLDTPDIQQFAIREISPTEFILIGREGILKSQPIKKSDVNPNYPRIGVQGIGYVTIPDNVAAELLSGNIEEVVNEALTKFRKKQLNEGEKVGMVDVDIVKKVIDKPEVQKMTDILTDNPDAAKKLAAALSDPKAMAILSGDSVSEAEETEKKYNFKERVMRFLKYTGVGSTAGALLTPIMLIGSATAAPAIIPMYIAGAIAGALIGAIGGSAVTGGFKKSLPFEEAEGQKDDLKSQIAQVIAFGKK